MAWYIDILLSGPPLLEHSGALSDEVALTNSGGPTDVVVAGSTLTYDLLGPDGVSVLSAPATATLVEANAVMNRFRATPTPTAALITGQVYRRVWTGTVSTRDPITGLAVSGSETTIRDYLDGYPAAYPQRYPPLGSAMIGVDSPALGTPPAAAGTWYPQIARAWFEVVMWALRQRKGEVWTPSELAVPCEHLARYYIWRAMASYGSASALANAALERTAYSLALKDVQIGWDTDGDGDLDAVSGPAGSAVGGGLVV